MSVLGRILRRPALPAGVALDPEERLLAVAEVVDGGQVAATSRGLWLPGAERLRWHLISKATWAGGSLAVIATREVEDLAGAVLIADQPVRLLRLARPGRVPEVVHRRVTGSIRSRQRRDLPGGGAWFVQRAVPGRDGTVLQVRADPGTDLDAVRRVVTALRLDG